MKVTIFGTGYVGLVQAAVLAEVGHQVCCVDVDDARIAALRLGRSPSTNLGWPRWSRVIWPAAA